MNWLSRNWLQLTAILLVAGAIPGIFPFAYYQLMNWVVLGASLMVAYHASHQNRMVVTWVFIFIGVIFNPVAPFSLRSDVWHVLDIVVIVLFIISLMFTHSEPDAKR